MKIRILSAVFLAALVLFPSCDRQVIPAGDFSLVSPLPREIVRDSAGTPVLLAETDLQAAMDALGELPAKGKVAVGKRGKLRLALDPSLGNTLKDFQQQECYQIVAGKGRITITAPAVEGILHGINTLCKTGAAIPAGTVFDYPEFPYRAFMLDCSRHFFPADYIKQFIDILALHNLNYFHWHLSDDQGWRLEIKKYPLLTEVGSYRPGTVYDSSGKMDDVPVSGFYTQEEAREIVRYAAERGITVIPEIDLPGHTTAILAAYPSLGCTGGPYEVCTRYGVFDDVLCVGKDETISFLKDVLTELMDIFPSPYIHLGGDECPKVRWESCPDCQRKIRELGLKGNGSKTKEELLQSWFTSEMGAFLSEHGRQMICWNDVLCDWGDQVTGEPSKSTVIAAWMRPESAAVAAREGYDAITCPVGHFYFSNATNNRLEGIDLIRSVYDLPVIPEGLTPEERKHIIGAEACMWSERVADTDNLEWKLLPRLSTLAELQWSDPASHDLDAYLLRLKYMTDFYEASGWNVRRVIP